MYDPDEPKFDVLLGMTMKRVEKVGDDRIDFESVDGRTFKLFHDQDCCEYVSIEDVVGDLSDLVGSPITMAEESTNLEAGPKDEDDESHTWTFYRLATVRGYVTIRWYGTSNGCYSESVDFCEVTQKDPKGV